MAPAGGRLVVGLVRGVHGLQGAVRVEPLSDDPARFEPGSRLCPEGSTRRLTVAWSQADGPGILVRFREVTTREAADTLRDTYLEADAPAASPGPDEYWWHEVIGATATTLSGEVLGTVEDIFRAGGGEVYVVRGGPRGELLVPAVRAVIREFAPRDGRLVVDADALGLDEIAPRRPRGRRSSRAARAGTVAPAARAGTAAPAARAGIVAPADAAVRTPGDDAGPPGETGDPGTADAAARPPGDGDAAG